MYRTGRWWASCSFTSSHCDLERTGFRPARIIVHAQDFVRAHLERFRKINEKRRNAPAAKLDRHNAGNPVGRLNGSFQRASLEWGPEGEVVEIKEAGAPVRELGGAQGGDDGSFHVSAKCDGAGADGDDQVNGDKVRSRDVRLVACQPVPVQQVDELRVLVHRDLLG